MSEKITYLNLRDFVCGRKLIIFGASILGVQAIHMINNEIDVSYICDNDKRKHGKFLLGREIKAADSLENEDIDNIVVLIASTYVVDISFQLSSMGIKNIVIHKDLLGFMQDRQDKIINVVGKEFHIDGMDKDVLSNIATLFNLIEKDDYSKELLSYVIKSRMERNQIDWNFIRSNQIRQTPYFSNEIFFKNAKDEIIIDGGLENCNDFLHFYKVFGNSLKKIYGFEPDRESFEMINLDLGFKKVLKYDEKSYKSIREVFEIKIFPYALSDCNGTTYINGNKVSGSSVYGDLIETRTIDELIDPDEKITLIKLDIEGAELSALKGASRTILNHKPRLMVCLYHKPADLWEIPVFIKKLCPDYKLYVRPHDGNKFVLELHAVCE